MSILTSADQSSSFIWVSLVMIVRTSPLLLVCWLFPGKKETEGLTSPSFAETLWKLVGWGRREERGSPRTIFRSIWISGIWWAGENNFLFPPPLPPRIDGRPSRHYSQCCECCPFFFFSFLQSTRPVEWNQVDRGWSITWPNAAGSYV